MDKKVKIAPVCKHLNKVIIKGLCWSCYQRRRNGNLGMAECHPDKKAHAAGICRSCYKKGKRARKANCHKQKRHYAKGLCCSCYHKLPEQREKVALQRRCKKYGILPETFKLMTNNQNKRCLICLKEKPLRVDHCHESGRIRGLLCTSCNLGLGALGDSKALLLRAVDYLEGKCAVI